MKRIVLFMALVCWTQAAWSQTWSEWFRQKKTQLKYLREQIGELEIYIELARKGYTVVKDGLHVIDQIKRGEFSLHQAFIASLSAINPSIRSYANVTAMAERQVQLYARYRQLVKDVQTTSWLTTTEQEFIREAAAELMRQATQTLDAYIALTTAGKLSLKDDERLRRIDAVREESVQQEQDLTRMCTNVAELVAARRTQRTEIEQMRKWQGIDK